MCGSPHPRLGRTGQRFIVLVTASALSLTQAAPAPAVTFTSKLDAATDSLNLAEARLYNLEAARAGDMALAALKSLGGRTKPDSLEVIRGIDILVEAWLAAGHPIDPTFVWYAKHAVNERRRLEGDRGLAISPCLHNLADVTYLQGKVDEALEMHEQAMKLRKERFGENDPRTAESMSRVASFLYSAAFAGKGEDDALGSVANFLFGAVALPMISETISKGSGEGMLEDYLFDEGQADKVLEASKSLRRSNTLVVKAYETRRARLEPGDLALAESLELLARMDRERGDLEAAQKHIDEARDIYAASLGPEAGRALRCRVTLGEIALEQLAYPQSRETFAAAVEEFKRDGFGDTTLVLRAYLGLGKAHEAMKDSALARAAYESALLYLGVDGRAAREYGVRTEVALGRFDTARGQYRSAQQYLTIARGRAVRLLGAKHTEVARVDLELGRLEKARGDTGNAMKSFQRALETLEDALGPRHALVGECLYEIALMEGNRTNWQKALRALDQSLGPSHPVTALARMEQAYFYRRTGQGTYTVKENGEEQEFDDTYSIAIAGYRGWRQHLSRTVEFLPESEAIQLASTPTLGFDIAIGYADCSTLSGHFWDSDYTKQGCGRAMEVWDEVIRSRGLVFDRMAERQRQVNRADDSTTAELRRTAVSARRRLATLVTRAAGSAGGASYAATISDAVASVNATEKQLYDRSAQFRERVADRDVGAQDVTARLAQDAAMVSYRRCIRISDKYREWYVAFVARGGKKRVALGWLGAAETIDRVVERWREEASRGALSKDRTPEAQVAAYRGVGDELRKLIWDPLGKYLKGARDVYVVPDGSLHLVNLAALPVGSGGYVVEQDPVIRCLNAERDICERSPDTAASSRYLLMGGPDFDSALSTGPDPDSPKGAAARPDTEAQTFRGRLAECSAFDQVRFTPLPGAAEEVQNIAKEVAQAPKADEGHRPPPQPVTLVAADASTAAFERLAPGSEVVHIATHGFFLGGGCKAAAGNTRAIGAIEAVDDAKIPGQALSNPLRLSGLAFAGANRRATVDMGQDDGILTAEEITAMDLSGVRWTVLSACDTGVGDVLTSEGVFGLRRAFQIAGSKTLVMSLWPVDDQSTRAWMERLYQRYELGGRDTARAVRDTDVSILNERRSAGSSTHPFFWATFVAAGRQ
jgi:CHAT domain-containing protein/tetratricopeptide (TPR) repeat protein